MMRRLFFAMLLALNFTCIRAQMVAVSTDVLMDGLMIPSLGAELVVGERTSVGLGLFGARNPWGSTIKLAGVQPEWRYYFSGRSMHRQFIGICALGVSYDMKWKGKIYDGTAVGLGLTFGYVFALNKRLNIDLHAGFGVITYRQKEYFESDSFEADIAYGRTAQSNAKGYVLLPTRLGVSVAYILK